MFIEITGAGFSNKGAQLMLATVCQKLRQHVPCVRLSMPMNYDSYEQRAAYGLYFTLRAPEHWHRPRRLARDIVGNLVGRTSLRQALGLIPEREIDGLLDISGYAFGDKWPATKTERLARPAASLKKRHKPVIMLPQMLGPFTKPGQAAAFQKLSQQVDLIYAREQESFDHARPLVDPAKLRLAPDITIPTHAVPYTNTTQKPYACIVPNSKLLDPDTLQQDWKGTYPDRLVKACHHLLSQGLEITIVQHEHGAGDAHLAEALQKRLGSDRCNIFTHPDPLVLKGVLGGAEIVIGSRFHSLVSTLSMGVPAIALGWAHKYDALLRDFSVPELIHNAEDQVEHLTELIDTTLDQHADLQSTLRLRKLQLTEQVESMWTEVFTHLGIGHRPVTHRNLDASGTEPNNTVLTS